MADGRQIGVPHREFLSHSPGGRTVIVYHPDDTFSIVDSSLVTELKVHDGPVVRTRVGRTAISLAWTGVELGGNSTLSGETGQREKTGALRGLGPAPSPFVVEVEIEPVPRDNQ
jgi:hypothetical protein